MRKGLGATSGIGKSPPFSQVANDIDVPPDLLGRVLRKNGAKYRCRSLRLAWRKLFTIQRGSFQRDLQGGPGNQLLRKSPHRLEFCLIVEEGLAHAVLA